MWMFWIVAGLLAAGAAALVFAAAGRAARSAAGVAEDPALAVYRRQLSELDELSAQGMLTPEARASARAEAARRLLGQAETARRPERPGTARSRMAVALTAALAAFAALGVYLLLGAPGQPDQPYERRLAAWRHADPATLDPARMAAVLKTIAAERPHDPEAWEYYGRAQLAAGDAYGASRAFATAARLAPRRADLLAAEGEALAADNDGKVSPDALTAFTAALRLDPQNTAARYFIGRAKITGGDVQAGLADWRELLATMAPNDPRRAVLAQEIARGGQPAATPSGPPPGQMAFIRSMVAQQAAQLQAHPDDVQGWARLVRSYGVLGDKAAQAKALDSARRHFANRPDALRAINAEAPSA
jgi:cytochrome c-type biogenesis protein CcmH